MGFVPTQTDDGNICVPVGNADDVRTILEEIQRAGLALPGLDVRKPNLEEVFLKLTGVPRDDRANGGAE